MNLSSIWSDLSVLRPSYVAQSKQDVDDELAFHVEMILQEYRAEGYSEDAARGFAASQFGDRAKIRKACLKEQLALPVSIKLLAVLVLNFALLLAIDTYPRPQWQRVSPFEAVQIVDQNTTVNIDDQWYELRSINNHSIDQILAHSKDQYRSMWQRRFVEDIYEVLDGLGALSGMTVDVELVNADGLVITKRLSMTKQKRMMVWLYAREQQATTDRQLEQVKILRSVLMEIPFETKTDA